MILVSNDDGIFAPGLWVLVKELTNIDKVTAIAPDREQSATGTSVTLRNPLRVRKIPPVVEGAAAFGVEGTPGDSVIIGLEKLAPSADMVISGINSGQNLGDDVLISGTVGAALQGYLRNLPSIAISVGTIDERNLPAAGRLAALLAGRINRGVLPRDIFLNVNLPDERLNEIKGIRMTHLAHKTHIDSVKEGNDGRRDYYWLVRRKLDIVSLDDTDIWAVEHGYISITALHSALFRRPEPLMNENFCAEMFQELYS